MERTTDLMRGLREGTALSRIQAEGFVRKMIAEDVIRPTKKLGRGGTTNSFAFPKHATEATSVVAFVYGMGLRDRDALTSTWESLLTPPADGEPTPISRILAELEAHGCEDDLPAIQVTGWLGADGEKLVGTRVFHRGAPNLDPPQREGYGVAWHVNLRLGVVLQPFVVSANETAH